MFRFMGCNMVRGRSMIEVKFIVCALVLLLENIMSVNVLTERVHQPHVPLHFDFYF